MDFIIYWLRWLAVLPGALLAGVLSSFPLHWVLYRSLNNETISVGNNFETIERFLFPFVFNVVYVWAGARIAPEHNVKTAVALFGSGLFLIGGFFFLTTSGASWMGNNLYFIGGGLGPIMAIVGSIVGLYTVWWQNEELAHEDIMLTEQQEDK